ncbi:MAG: hypothetical protein H0W28_08900 [Pyrinomonadaceae bacterium]|jgi:hypothetical protein|nr:hypothetical protein [Pyrinomonadaceae bacterium]
MRREELVFRGQNVGLKLLQEALIEARADRKVVFEELVEKQWIAKGKSKETMSNFFDLQTRNAKDYVEASQRESSKNLKRQKASRSGRTYRNLSQKHGRCRHLHALWVLCFTHRLGFSGFDYREIAVRGVGFYMHFKCGVLQQG